MQTNFWELKKNMKNFLPNFVRKKDKIEPKNKIGPKMIKNIGTEHGEMCPLNRNEQFLELLCVLGHFKAIFTGGQNLKRKKR